MKFIKYILFISTLYLISCASLPPQNPQSENSSIIGISLEIKRSFFPPDPKEVFFIKLNETGDSYLSRSKIIKSNYNKNNQYYLLNATPGRYLAIASFEDKVNQKFDSKGNLDDESTTYFTYYLPLDVIQLTDVNLQSGQVAFMGKYILDLPFNFNYGISNPDEAQYYYCERIQPNKANPSATGCLIEALISIFLNTDEVAEALKLKEKMKDNKTEIEFWLNTKKDFEGDKSQKKYYKDQVEKNKIWLNIIDKHLANMII